MRSIIRWLVENHVAATMLKVFVVVAGLLQLLTIKVEVFPEASLDQISITVNYPNASPEEVEDAIVNKIEDRVVGLDGVRKVTSIAAEGIGVVTIEVAEDRNVQDVLDDVKTEVGQITTFPEEAEAPIIRKNVLRMEVMDLVVYGDVSDEVLKRAAQIVKDEVIRLPHVSLADVVGARESEIHIEIPQETLRSLGLTLRDIASVVRQLSLNLPSGKVTDLEGEVLFRAAGRVDTARFYNDLVVMSLPDGSKLRIRDLGKAREGFEDVGMSVRYNGKPAMLIVVYRVSKQNALTVAKEIKEYLPTLKRKLPPGVDISYFADMSRVLKDRITLLLKNLAMGFVLVIFILGIFLDFRLSFWVSAGIPVSFLAAFAVMPFVDVSVNMVSLFAFIMVLGIVVDDAIVVGENVFRKSREGLNPVDASVEGTVDVGIPVIFSVLTTLVAFAPLLGGSGMMGKIMRNIPLVVILVLTGSLLEAIFILPSHLSRSVSLKDIRPPKPADRLLAAFVSGPYRRLMGHCLEWRYLVFAFFIALIALSFGIWKAGWVGYTFFPNVESDWIVCSLRLPTGASEEKTRGVVREVEKRLEEVVKEIDPLFSKGEDSLVKSVSTMIGVQMNTEDLSGRFVSGSHLAQIVVELLPAQEREVSSTVIMNRWRERCKGLPGLEEITFQSTLFSPGKPIQVNLYGDDEALLREAAGALKKALSGYAGVYDIGDSMIAGKPEMKFDLLPWGRFLGLTLQDVAAQVRHAFYGAEALRFQRGNDEVKVLVRLPEDERKTPDSLENLYIRTPAGKWVQFRDVASARMSRGYTYVEHEAKQRVVKVKADVNSAVANAKEIRKDLAKKVLPGILATYPGVRYSFEGEAREERESLRDVFKGFGVALIGIYTLLAIPFRSFTQPLIVMTAIPFGIIGALIGHILLGYDISIVTLFGIVGLSGVVVNDSLVLVERINKIRLESKGMDDTVLEAVIVRFRAVVLTSLTTFAGLMPIIFEKSVQARVLIPMAISLGFGIVFATMVTLVLVPCLYLILEDFHLLVSKTKVRLRGLVRPVER